MQAKIVDIVEGRKGQPGEIKGIFSEDQKKIGIIKKNTPYGLFGKLYGDTRHFEQREMLPICRQSDVKLGEAEILSTIDNEGIKAYTVNIIKINKQNYPHSKGMIIEITDPGTT